ncbi:MAG: thioredoxin domain-containing protein [Rubricoccaceae bacterium]|nr:thioredoxin domain-containing protein [Rubricoccaceae bacterium]
MMEDERQKIEEEYDPDGEYEDRSFSMLQANFSALALVGPPIALALTVFVLLYGWAPLYTPVQNQFALSIVLVIAGVVVHEILHVVAWKLAARPPSGTVRLGFYWKALTPYAHCSVPMSAKDYQIGAATPGIVLGIIPIVVGLALGWGGWMMFGMLFTLAAGGDALIIWLLRGVPGVRLVKDHPSKAGCLVLAENRNREIAQPESRAKQTIKPAKETSDFPPVTNHDHVRGASDAEATLIQYGDFECPQSRQVHVIVQSLLRLHPDKIRFVFRHFPVKTHPNALQAAEAAEAAASQHAFWPMHDRLFNHQLDLAPDDLIEHAREIGIDPREVETALREEVFRNRVLSQKRTGVKAGIRSSFNLIVDGRVHQDEAVYEAVEALDDRLKENG